MDHEFGWAGCAAARLEEEWRMQQVVGQQKIKAVSDMAVIGFVGATREAESARRGCRLSGMSPAG